MADSEKCTIPVDIIRNACSWFGVLFDMDREQLLLCRREPGDKVSAGDMFILRDKEIAIPDQIEKNNTNITLAQAREYGLTKYVANDADDFVRQVDEFRAISQKQITDASVELGHVTYLSEDIVALRREEQKIFRELFAARKRHTEILQLMKTMGEYDKSLPIQLDRLDISTWLRSNMVERSQVMKRS